MARYSARIQVFSLWTCEFKYLIRAFEKNYDVVQRSCGRITYDRPANGHDLCSSFVEYTPNGAFSMTLPSRRINSTRTRFAHPVPWLRDSIIWLLHNNPALEPKFNARDAYLEQKRRLLS